MAREAAAAASNNFLDPLVQAIMGAFNANPIYAIVILVVGFIVGWFLHYQVFGY